MTNREMKALEADLMRKWRSDWYEPDSRKILTLQGMPCIINPNLAYDLKSREN